MAAAVAAAADVENPLLKDFEFPPFDSVEADHVRPGFALCSSSSRSRIPLSSGCYRGSSGEVWKWMINSKHFERKKKSFCSVSHSSLDTVLNVRPQPDKVKFQLRLGQSKPIYNAFKAIQESPEWQHLSDARKRIVEGQIKEAVLSGVALEDEKREEFNKLSRYSSNELERLSQKFDENVLDATKKFENLSRIRKRLKDCLLLHLGWLRRRLYPRVTLGQLVRMDHG
ncbi:unnamed protein product [Linum tenue]|uniref:Oligopeptidase A N-terminal domain-containing protein n=1 Tax=Linum tenue TaxID=586396 RepID=A0AAV0QTZ7_9ROSI|nr:unnamed protein product [Linum tenue]